MPVMLSRLSTAGFRLGNVLATHSGALVWASFLIVGLAVFDDYSVSMDEDRQRSNARANLRVILSPGEGSA